MGFRFRVAWILARPPPMNQDTALAADIQQYHNCLQALCKMDVLIDRMEDLNLQQNNSYLPLAQARRALTTFMTSCEQMVRTAQQRILDDFENQWQV